MMYEHIITPTGVLTRTYINGKPANITIPIPDGIENGDKWSRGIGIQTLERCVELGWVQVTENQYMCCYCEKIISGDTAKEIAQKACECRTKAVLDTTIA